MKIIDFVLINAKSKTLTLRNRNYFFVTTLTIVLINFIMFSLRSKVPYVAIRPNWSEFAVENLCQALINTYSHSNFQHVTLNMLCFFIAGIYLERKQGSLKFLVFMIIMSAFTAFATVTNDLSLGWRGFSAANYGLYGFIIVEVVFMFARVCDYKPLFDVIAGLAIAGLIYFAMCFCGGTTSVAFKPYPYDLFYNLGHASGFIAGLIFGVYESVCEILRKNGRAKHLTAAEKQDIKL